MMVKVEDCHDGFSFSVVGFGLSGWILPVGFGVSRPVQPYIYSVPYSIHYKQGGAGKISPKISRSRRKTQSDPPTPARVGGSHLCVLLSVIGETEHNEASNDDNQD